MDLPRCSTSHARTQPKRRMAAWVRNLSTLRSKKHLHGIGRTTITASGEGTSGSVGHRARLRDIAGFSDEDPEVEADVGGVYIGDDVSLEYPPLEPDCCIVSDIDYMRGSGSTLSSARSASLQSLPETARRVMWSEDFDIAPSPLKKRVAPAKSKV